jgi:hypothetical protein
MSTVYVATISRIDSTDAPTTTIAKAAFDTSQKAVDFMEANGMVFLSLISLWVPLNRNSQLPDYIWGEISELIVD